MAFSLLLSYDAPNGPCRLVRDRPARLASAKLLASRADEKASAFALRGCTAQCDGSERSLAVNSLSPSRLPPASTENAQRARLPRMAVDDRGEPPLGSSDADDDDISDEPAAPLARDFIFLLNGPAGVFLILALAYALNPPATPLIDLSGVPIDFGPLVSQPQ